MAYAGSSRVTLLWGLIEAAIGLRAPGDRLYACGEGQQGNIPRALDRFAKGSLVDGAGSRQTARKNLAALGNEPTDQTEILIVDDVDLLFAKLAHLPPAEELLSGTSRSAFAPRMRPL
jgi:hypothetical protein